MNVFILCTGRCGSTTFAKACGHITNYSSGHESRARAIGDERMAYPDNHIEADNRLSWFLGRLDQQFGSNAFYVHLWREPAEAVAHSLLAQGYDKPHAIVRAFHQGIVRGANVSHQDAALDCVRTVTENIRHFLSDKPNKMDFPLDRAGSLFPQFWESIGAEGNLEAALNEFAVKHNPTKPPPTFPHVANHSARRTGGRILRALGLRRSQPSVM